VLQAATLRAAEVLDRYAEIGSLLPGRRADVVLLEADPLLDIHNLARVRAVFQAGVVARKPSWRRSEQARGMEGGGS
jgi:imidazolonepropionase-like amidohydrolase